MTKPKHVILLGPPASGKGTQARKLATILGVACLGTGKLLRSEIEKGTELGKTIGDFINRGDYVPDAFIMAMVDGWIKENEAGWLLDGYPRTQAQAEHLDRSAAPDLVIALDVPRQDLEQRITKRRECQDCGVTVAVVSADQKQCPECKVGTLVARTDDALESFKQRYLTYEKLTMPLAEYYHQQGLLKHVDGTQSPEQVYAAILEIINS